MIQIKCENVSLGYEGKSVVENLNFQVEKGDYICVIGENGTGKSTLMKSILGLLPHLSGNIEKSDSLIAGKIGYLPQQNAIQRDFPASVFEIVLSGCLSKMGYRPFYSKKEKEIALKNLEKLNITNLKKKCYRELSGGQQQRVLLARALCATSDILLLDEPTNGLDPKASSELYSIIKDLNNEGITIFMISHDVDEAVNYASKILHLGKKAYFGSKDDYVEKNKLLVKKVR
ncbi:MAG: metal ABC transporter ATP-binding protein [Lachnospirales bacterium]